MTTPTYTYLLAQVLLPRQVHRAVGGGVGPAAARHGDGRPGYDGDRARRVPVRTAA